MLERVAELMGASRAVVVERVQSLWSGYGEIVRVALHGADVPSVIVKRIAPPSGPESARHPRGWNTSRSHARKLRSYEVEATWYAAWSARCPADARVPRFFGAFELGAASVVVLEDLDAAGFGGRRSRVTEVELDACLRWLSTFHATFLGVSPHGLWEDGTYWHLATRPDELAALDDAALRAAAPRFDERLRAARYRTIVHGDAKVANFCFGASGVAAVDFQYVGGGCGVQDVGYFLGSVLDERELMAAADRWLDRYFEHLAAALPDAAQAAAVEAEWRDLDDFAWADFARFLLGWAPGGDHRKLHGYTAQRVARALERIRT